MSEDVQLLLGDARSVLASLPAQSVHCAITSPPYFGLRAYGGGAEEIGTEQTPAAYVAALVEVFRAVQRVLRDDGTLWVVLGDTYNSGTQFNHHKSGLRAADRYRESADGLAWSGHRRAMAGIRAKSLLGIPWRVAFALQDDGWILRAEIVWSKPNPMPESVRDRVTRAHETVFMLAKGPRYYYDADAIREPHAYGMKGGAFSARYRAAQLLAQNGSWNVERTMNPAGRNRRSVWTVATSPLSAKKYGVQTEHYAAFPPELVRPMVRAATSERGVCPACGAPWRRVVQRERFDRSADRLYGGTLGHNPSGKVPGSNTRGCPTPLPVTCGWQRGCSCAAVEPRPATVLDPFMGSGTSGLVAVQEGRRFVGIDLNADYCTLARHRIASAQPPLLLLNAATG